MKIFGQVEGIPNVRGKLGDEEKPEACTRSGVGI
jgi:hypothetical protein